MQQGLRNQNLLTQLDGRAGGEGVGAVLRDDAGDGDVGAAEGVDDLALAQARGVVFEGELVFGGVKAEAAQTVGVGEFSQVGHLFGAERGLQLKGEFYEGHGSRIIADCASQNGIWRPACFL